LARTILSSINADEKWEQSTREELEKLGVEVAETPERGLLFPLDEADYFLINFDRTADTTEEQIFTGLSELWCAWIIDLPSIIVCNRPLTFSQSAMIAPIQTPTTEEAVRIIGDEMALQGLQQPG